MKKLFALFAAAAISLVAGCSKEYDDTNVWSSINSLEQRLSAMETVMNAYKNNLFIKSVQKSSNGYIITFSDGSTATIANGIDGVNGDTLIDYIVVGENEVTFVLTDGRTFSIALYSTLTIEFAEGDLVTMSPNSTREIGYTVTSATKTVKVEVTSSADIKAKVVANDSSGLTGKIHIATGATIDEYSKAVVFVSDGDKVIMRSITFEETGLVVEENSTKHATAEGGEVALEFLSNAKCEVVIPEDAQSWISVVPDTRAMERQTITLKLEPNKGYYRSAAITVQTPDETLKFEYQIGQYGDLGMDVPDNEIWYVSAINEPLELTSVLGFGAKMLSHTFNNGIFVIKFDGPVLNIPKCMFDYMQFWYRDDLKTIYLPKTLKSIQPAAFYSTSLTELNIPYGVESIGDEAFLECNYLNTITIPASVKNIGSGLLGSCRNLKSIQGDNPYISEDNRMIIIDGVLNSVASAGLTDFTIPNTVSIVGYKAFSDNETLANVIIPNSVVAIEDRAFDMCSGLKEINLPNSVKKIGQWAFRGNQATTINIPESVETIGEAAFNSCYNLKSFSGKFASEDGIMLIVGGEIVSAVKSGIVNLVIPSNVKHIGSVFSNVHNLETVSISEGVEIIDSDAFSYNRTLKSINIPNSVTSIGSGIVTSCPNLEQITGKYASEDGRCLIVDGVLNSFASANLEEYTLPENVTAIGWRAFTVFGLGGLKTVHLPEGLVTIYSEAFRSCGLETITLPSTLKYLYESSFASNGSLKDIYCKSLIPPAFVGESWDNTVFREIHPSATIYVPQSQVDLYKKEWAGYSSMIKGYDFGTDIPDHYISSDYSKDGTVETLQTATKGNGIDIVLMGDAYSDRQIADGTYRAYMETIYNNLFTVEPYKSFKDCFNVRYVNVVSATEGYEYGATALGGYFGDEASVGGNDNAVFDYALNAISEAEMDEALLIVVMNSDNNAGTCYMYYPTYATGTYGSGTSVTYFPGGCDDGMSFAPVLHHEAFGHGFAKLADEYAYEYMGAVPSDYVSEIQSQQSDWGWFKNVDFTSNPAEVRWNYFLSDYRYANDGLGVFEGGLTYWSGVWRPTENSIMRYNTGGFNAPSREAIYYRIHKLAYGDSWEYDYEKFVEWDARNRTSAAAAARAKSGKPAHYKPTHPPVIVNKSWRDAK